jgi:hypothetical protein
MASTTDVSRFGDVPGKFLVLLDCTWMAGRPAILKPSDTRKATLLHLPVASA